MTINWVTYRSLTRECTSCHKPVVTERLKLVEPLLAVLTRDGHEVTIETISRKVLTAGNADCTGSPEKRHTLDSQDYLGV